MKLKIGSEGRGKRVIEIISKILLTISVLVAATVIPLAGLYGTTGKDKYNQLMLIAASVVFATSMLNIAVRVWSW